MVVYTSGGSSVHYGFEAVTAFGTPVLTNSNHLTTPKTFGLNTSVNNLTIGTNRIELAQLDVKKSGNVFRKLTNPAQIIDKDDFGDLPDFDFDPFKISNQSGFHTIQFGETQE